MILACCFIEEKIVKGKSYTTVLLSSTEEETEFFTFYFPLIFTWLLWNVHRRVLLKAETGSEVHGLGTSSCPVSNTKGSLHFTAILTVFSSLSFGYKSSPVLRISFNLQHELGI